MAEEAEEEVEEEETEEAAEEAEAETSEPKEVTTPLKALKKLLNHQLSNTTNRLLSNFLIRV